MQYHAEAMELELKADGATVTGTLVGPPLKIQDGQVEGNTITLNLAGTNPGQKATMTGQISANEIVFEAVGLTAQPFHFVAVRDQMAFGWKAFGEVPGRPFVEHLLIPLDSPSVIQAASASENGLVHGPVTPSTVNIYLYKVLGCSEPRRATAGVVMIGKRIVNVLYGHGKELAQDQIDELLNVCKSAAVAYARLLAVQKQRSGPTGSP
jgi:hypothetical protein